MKRFIEILKFVLFFVIFVPVVILTIPIVFDMKVGYGILTIVLQGTFWFFVWASPIFREICLLVLKAFVCMFYYIGKLFYILIFQLIPQGLRELYYTLKYKRLWFLVMLSNNYKAKQYLKSSKWYYGY